MSSTHDVRIRINQDTSERAHEQIGVLDALPASANPTEHKTRPNRKRQDTMIKEIPDRETTLKTKGGPAVPRPNCNCFANLGP